MTNLLLIALLLIIAVKYGVTLLFFLKQYFNTSMIE